MKVVCIFECEIHDQRPFGMDGLYKDSKITLGKTYDILDVPFHTSLQHSLWYIIEDDEGVKAYYRTAHFELIGVHRDKKLNKILDESDG